jgi:hypothetical protein
MLTKVVVDADKSSCSRQFGHMPDEVLAGGCRSKSWDLIPT